MPKETLKTNPYYTYRDPQTGRWVVTSAAPANTDADNCPPNNNLLTTNPYNTYRDPQTGRWLVA
mgnify:CR=1 FL=1